MCSGSKPPQDSTKQNYYADVVQWLGDDWEQRFKPIEEGLLDEVMNKDQNIRKNVDEAGLSAQKSYEATLGMSERNMARYGTEMSADQKAAMDRSNSLNANASQIGSRGMARDATSARYDQLQTGLVGLGTGVKTGAISGFGSTAGMEASRNAQNQQMYAQNKAGFWNTLGSAASTGAMLYMMSSKDSKKNIRKASPRKALKDVESVDLKHYDYKPGMSAGRVEKGHIGGMAEDMPDSMTSPDHKMVDIGDTAMNLIGATQELSNRVKKLEHRNHGR